MPDRRGSRFILEVLFLLALAGVLTLTDLTPVEIAGVMLIGWIVVALFEWAAWRDEPHYGSGLPPRYYVPQINLPPAQPLEAVSGGYPEARDEAPTWIASPALRAEMLGEWPVAAPPLSPAEADADPWTHAEELPVAPLDEREPVEELPVADVEPIVLPPLSVPEPLAVIPPEPVAEPQPVAEVEPEPVVAEPEAEPAPEPDASLDVVLVRTAQGVARYSLDPLAEPQPRRRFARGGAPELPALEVPARPEGARALPGRTNRQD